MVSFVSGIEQLLQGTTVKIDYELNGSSPVPGTRADNLMGNGHEIQSEKNTAFTAIARFANGYSTSLLK